MFPSISENYKNRTWLSERAKGKNKDVAEINASILEEIDGQFVANK